MRKFLPYGFHWIDDADIKEVIEVLKSDWIIMGPKVEEFESTICKYIGCKHGVAVNSGTSALDIAVASLGLKEGEVITTPFTFVATANSILYNGLKLVFADIKEDTYNIDPEQIKNKISKNTKAIIYVDFAGQPCDIEEIGAIAEAHDLYLIEDAAHALGAEYAGKKVGTFADITMFSFHPVKHITTGEGGMCGTDDEELSRRMRILRNQGADTGARERFGPSASWAYDVKLLGRNYRMTDFQAALGLSQMKKLDGRIKRRQELADKYSKGLKNTPLITLPCTKPNVKHVWHLYTILLDRKIDREKFIAAMRAKNIGVSVHYCPVYRFSYYKKNFDFRPADFPVTEDVSSRIVTLPLFPKMSDKDVNDVVTAVEESIEALVK
ncbi:MAG: UDP-4-amino-4,6-dideoxy-N-acetyl-beta-L-altrosamine transaminase [Candidatus Hadarchaeaceae archaeon]